MHNKQENPCKQKLMRWKHSLEPRYDRNLALFSVPHAAAIADSMSANRFENLKRFFHENDKGAKKRGSQLLPIV